jgi:hypothetical protein
MTTIPLCMVMFVPLNTSNVYSFSDDPLPYLTTLTGEHREGLDGRTDGRTDKNRQLQRELIRDQ